MALCTRPNVTPNPYDFLYFAENYKISLQTFNQRCIVTVASVCKQTMCTLS